MTIKQLINQLREVPSHYIVGSGGSEQGSGSVKYAEIDHDAEKVTLWNITEEEVRETFGY